MATLLTTDTSGLWYREIWLSDREQCTVSRYLARSETHFVLFRYLYKIAQCTHRKATQQKLKCDMSPFIFQKQLFYKGFSHSEWFFVHELVRRLPLTPMHSTELPAAVWLPWCDESAVWNCGIAKMTYMTVPSFYLPCPEPGNPLFIHNLCNSAI